MGDARNASKRPKCNCGENDMTSFREMLSPHATRFGTYVRDHEVLRVATELVEGEQALRSARNEVLTWAKKRVGQQLPKEAWDHGDFELNVAGRNTAAIRIQRHDVDIWTIRAEDPDKLIPGRVWTTEVTLARNEKGVGKFGVRLLASSGEDTLDIEPHVPGFVMQIAQNCGLIDGNHEIRSSAGWVTEDDHIEQFVDLLLDPERKLPIIALSCPTGEEYPLLSQDSLAKSMTGLAHVLVLGDKAAWRITEEFGKVYSVYQGAVRTYLPGFTDGCSPYSHSLLLAERLREPKDRRTLEAELRGSIAQRSVAQTILGQDVLTFAEVKRASIELRRENLVATEAAPNEKLVVDQQLLEAQNERIEQLRQELEYFDAEHKRAEGRAETAELQLRGANARIEQLQAAMRARGQEPDADLALPSMWDEFADWCDNNLAGRVALSSKARRQTKSPDYEDVATAAKSLLWLANQGRELRMNGGEGSIAEYVILDGVRNAHCGGDTFKFDWQGRKLDADWHIKNGGNTRDPKRCLRIYYAWDHQNQQIVIAEMPAHIRTSAT